jgi:hypothetical protein
MDEVVQECPFVGGAIDLIHHRGHREHRAPDSLRTSSVSSVFSAVEKTARSPDEGVILVIDFAFVFSPAGLHGGRPCLLP